MATPSHVKQPTPRGKVAVVIELDSQGNIVVEPDKFWVHKSEFDEVRWYCLIKHEHGDSNHPCFVVDFKENGSPFQNSTFKGDRASSGPPIVPAGSTEFKYTVTVGSKTLDPKGGVKA
jgi:hypothetical protein